ncbi:MAG: type II toxin-antitoxin system VapC family toxin [Candidatus Bathyarchaeota archaeon]|nr:type II toxin-antitoxin system VapC family toxin [Candidatus Bathyarchaeota archaeon]
MSYVFDSSSIFRAIKENLVEVLAGNYTLELTRYELGNVLWKENTLHRRVNSKELTKLAKVVKKVLNLMEISTVSSREEEVLSIAEKLKLTFYDASYVCHAKDKKLPLATEDASIIDKAKPYIKVLKLDDLI